MPNGHYEPQCFNCQYVKRITEDDKDVWICQKHQVQLPTERLVGNIICSDYAFDVSLSRDVAYKYSEPQKNFETDTFFREMDSGILYSYSYVSPEKPKIFCKFKDLTGIPKNLSE